MQMKKQQQKLSLIHIYGAEELGDDIRDGAEGVGDTLERNMDNATGSENSSENSNAMGTGNGNATRQKERVCLTGSFFWIYRVYKI